MRRHETLANQAEKVEEDARELARAKMWREAAEAFEVAVDAWEVAGRPSRARSMARIAFNMRRRAESFSKMTLRQAASAARALGLLHLDYHSMTSEDKRELADIRNQTQWRQSSSARSRGQSSGLSFYEALQRVR